MTTSRGIPPVSDYAHWNEDAQRVWYEENKYDMEHPEVFEPDVDDWLEAAYEDRYRDDEEDEDDDA